MAGSPAVGRVTATLTFLAQHPHEAFTLSELCRELNHSPATAHALLNSLVSEGFLLREPASRKYSLGPALVEIGAAAAARQGDVLDFARAELKELATALRRQCVVTQVVGHRIVFMAREGPASAGGIAHQVGERVPFEPPIGTVFLAWSQREEIEDWLRGISPALGSRAIQKCMRALRQVRERGHSMSLATRPHSSRLTEASLDHLLNSRYFVDEIEPRAGYAVSHIGAPVFGADGRVVIALSCAYLGEVVTGRQLRRDAAEIVAAADRVTKAIHGRKPDLPSY
ncbi:MAG TPA: helix-turn-helix domain-containing protein [Amycolatopsis sp.]|nr:helix-turn-helix domain-containing protein [Amycolatopsis sp.]